MRNVDQIVALERELIATRGAAVRLILRMSEMMVATDAGRLALAEGYDGIAQASDEVTARLARLVAEALRRG